MKQHGKATGSGQITQVGGHQYNIYIDTASVMPDETDQEVELTSSDRARRKLESRGARAGTDNFREARNGTGGDSASLAQSALTPQRVSRARTASVSVLALIGIGVILYSTSSGDKTPGRIAQRASTIRVPTKAASSSTLKPSSSLAASTSLSPTQTNTYAAMPQVSDSAVRTIPHSVSPAPRQSPSACTTPGGMLGGPVPCPSSSPNSSSPSGGLLGGGG